MDTTKQEGRIDRLVIVGAGFVGAALARRVDAHERTLTVRSDASRERLASEGFDVRTLDVTDADAVRRMVDGATHVVVSVAAGRGGDYRAIYAEGVGNVASSVGDAHLVYTSSTGVYAAADGSWVDEDSDLASGNERTTSLVAAENAVRAAGGAVARLSGLVGRDRGPHRRADRLAGTERSDGDGWINLAPLPTVLDALEAVLTRRWAGTVNVSAAAPWRRRDFYDAVTARAGVEPIRWQDKGENGGRRVRVDRLRRELGIEPRALDVDALFGDGS